jgi:hypothetical protein
LTVPLEEGSRVALTLGAKVPVTTVAADTVFAKLV